MSVMKLPLRTIDRNINVIQFNLRTCVSLGSFFSKSSPIIVFMSIYITTNVEMPSAKRGITLINLAVNAYAINSLSDSSFVNSHNTTTHTHQDHSSQSLWAWFDLYQQKKVRKHFTEAQLMCDADMIVTCRGVARICSCRTLTADIRHRCIAMLTAPRPHSGSEAVIACGKNGYWDLWSTFRQTTREIQRIALVITEKGQVGCWRGLHSDLQ